MGQPEGLGSNCNCRFLRFASATWDIDEATIWLATDDKQEW
jgi:hypothetical protein